MAEKGVPGLVPPGRSRCRPPRRPGRSCCCVTVKDPPDRPDPAIYSQDEQLAAGQVPTWDSPDIVTNFFVPWKLKTETEVTVRNLSSTASAVNTQVSLYTAPHGLGMQAVPLSAKVVSLAPGAQATLYFPLSQALLGGDQRIGTRVQIQHPHDQVLINSHGGQQIAGMTTKESGRNPTLHFPVQNASSSPRPITLTVLANSLGGVVTPGVHAFAPWEQIQASLKLHIPASLHDTVERVTVVAWAPDGSAIDGLTYVVTVND